MVNGLILSILRKFMILSEVKVSEGMKKSILDLLVLNPRLLLRKPLITASLQKIVQMQEI
jgi:hypothetical protein